MTPGQTSQSRGMPPVPIGIYCSPVTVQRGGLWLILWQLSLSDRSLGPLLYIFTLILDVLIVHYVGLFPPVNNIFRL